MKILIITQYYPPEYGAPQARLHEMAVRFLKKGHDLTVLTAMPNYPTGRIFEGYRGRIRMKEEIDGVRVIRIPIYPSKSTRTLPRLLSFISFAVSVLLFGRWGLMKPGVILLEGSPPFIAPSGRFLSKLLKAPMVLMVSDIWPDILVRMGRISGGVKLKGMLWLERWAYEHSEAVALTNPGAMEQVRERFPRVAVTVISNGVDTQFFSPDLRSEDVRRELGAVDETFLVGYCGLHGMAQGLEAVLDAAERLLDNSRVRIVMMGEGPVKEALQRDAERRGLTNVAFFEGRPRREIRSIVASCDAMLAPLSHRLPGTMPSKIYEALAAGAPPIVTRGCEAETLVEENRCGAAYEPQDGRSLADAIVMIASSEDLKAMRARGFALAARFDRDRIADRTERILEAVASGSELPEVTW